MLYSFVCNPVHIFYLFTSFSHNHPRLSHSPQPSSSVPDPQTSSSVPFSSTILVCPCHLNRPRLSQPFTVLFDY